MKSYDEIVKALLCCADASTAICSKCPYNQFTNCRNALINDVLSIFVGVQRNRILRTSIEKTEGTTEPNTDNVNHPEHYETGKFECIEVMQEALGADVTKDFCLGNAFKYIYRCQKKHDSPVEDVKKAIWYLNKFLDQCEV